MSFPQARQRQRQAQQQQQPHQQKPALTSSDQQRIKGWLNTVYAADVARIVEHFGNSPSATDIRVVDVDASGVTVAWKAGQKKKKNGKKEEEEEEMQFAVRQPSGAGSVLQEISDLATEATRALGLADTPKITADLASFNKRTLVDFAFVPPSVLVMGGVGIGLASLAHLALAEDVHPLLAIFRSLATQGTWYFVLVLVVVVHLLEAALVFVVCQLIKTFQPRQMNTRTQIQWTLGGAFFGVFCLHRFVVRLKRQFAMAESMKGPSLAGAAAGHAGTG
ncbi:hypothetical protein H4S06_000654 [Coemansia sp. BCRC 34490]|nr:hypothetical protein H4S06_000654 [Coemansia sp. BCRC 34490]